MLGFKNAAIGRINEVAPSMEFFIRIRTCIKPRQKRCGQNNKVTILIPL